MHGIYVHGVWDCSNNSGAQAVTRASSMIASLFAEFVLVRSLQVSSFGSGAEGSSQITSLQLFIIILAQQKYNDPLSIHIGRPVWFMFPFLLSY